MSGDPMIYRYLAQPLLAGDRLPCFEAALRFVYERDEEGAPTLAKLARVAVQRLVDWDTAHLQEAWYRGHRVWVWTDGGEFIGSIVVRLRLDPRLEAVDDTIQRVPA